MELEYEICNGDGSWKHLDTLHMKYCCKSTIKSMMVVQNIDIKSNKLHIDRVCTCKNFIWKDNNRVCTCKNVSAAGLQTYEAGDLLVASSYNFCDLIFSIHALTIWEALIQLSHFLLYVGEPSF
jgi:hypothetical protein